MISTCESNGKYVHVGAVPRGRPLFGQPQGVAPTNMLIKIYTTETCPFCHAAMDLLKDKGLKFEEIRLAGREEMDQLVEKTGWRTVPQIFFDEKLIGGFEELKKMDEEGKL